MNLDQETQQKIQQAQMLEQTFQQLAAQKHAFNMELNETDFALQELEKADGEVFKMVGSSVILKTTKEKLTEDLKQKQELLNTRLKSLDKQEEELSSKMEEIRGEIIRKISATEESESKEETKKEKSKK